MATSKNTNFIYNRSGFLRVAAAAPKVRLGDVAFNVREIISVMERTDKEGADIVIFPELSVTGYTAADLFFQSLLQQGAITGIADICEASRSLKQIILIGAPLSIEGGLYNVALVLYKGDIYGIVPKTYIPNYREFYEKRWFTSARNLAVKKIKEISLLGRSVPVGTDILFRIEGAPDAVLGIEICEDLWVPLPPSSFQVLRGANIIANLSASNDIVGKAGYRRELVRQQSGRGIAAYIYASCGPHESTTDLIFGGHALIAENGSILKESERFLRDSSYIISDIDIEHITEDRQRMDTFGEAIHSSPMSEFRFIDVPYETHANHDLQRFIDAHPFIPSHEEDRDTVARDIFSMQVSALAKRLEASDIKNTVIGVSGGLDSTLALLVIIETYKRIGLPLENIYAFTMPGFGTTNRTKSNIYTLCERLGIALEEIDITKTVAFHLHDIKHNMKDTKGITFQNAQARYRKMIELDKANQLFAINAGTGDLSEIGLGWNTFAGDHISTYNVMTGVPKTLVQYIVRWAKETYTDEVVQEILDDILATPISPELEQKEGNDIGQKTEDIIGPYELHDFFLYHFVRWGSSPKKILFLAEEAFKDAYPRTVLLKWLREFITRFFKNQWKRSVMPDGPKIGSVALSPRGDWRMPSDASVSLWLEELDEIEKS